MKSLKNIILATMLFSAALCSTASAVEVSGGAYVGFYDKYLWRGFDLSGSEPVMQGGVDLSAGSMTLSYWTNLQLNTDDATGLDAGDASETDIVIDYSTDINDMLSLSAGNIFYQLDGMEDTNELYLSLGLNTLLSPTFSIYYDWDKADETGLFYTVDVSHSIDLADSLSLGMGALVSYNQSSDYSVGDYDELHNYELSASLDYAIDANYSISASVMFSDGISDEAEDAIDSEVVSGVSVAFSF
ncbi:MAG: hypothetical protein R6V18_05560 [Desulfuromonadaceae bacterium]